MSTELYGNLSPDLKFQEFENNRILRTLKRQPNWTKITARKKKPWVNKQKRRKEKRRQSPRIPSFFRPLLFLLPTTIYINKSKISPTFRCSSSTLFKAVTLKKIKIFLPPKHLKDRKGHSIKFKLFRRI